VDRHRGRRRPRRRHAPYLRRHDDKIGEVLAKRGSAETGGSQVTRVVDPPALADIDLTKMDDRGNVVTAPAHGGRKVELTLEPKLQRAANGFSRPAASPRARS